MSNTIQQQLTEEQKKSIVDALVRKNVRTSCPMCGHPKFSLADGYSVTPIQKGLMGFSIGGPSIPAAVIVCENCGFFSQHALGVLGLLPKQG